MPWYLFLATLNLLGAFSNVQKAVISSVMTVRPSLHPSSWNNSNPSKRVFVKFYCWRFIKICRDISDLVKFWEKYRAHYISIN